MHDGVDDAQFIFNLLTENFVYILYNYTNNKWYVGITPCAIRKKAHLLGTPMSCSWWRIPIHSGPLLETNCRHPYFPNPPLTPTHPIGPVLYYNNNLNFLQMKYNYAIYQMCASPWHVFGNLLKECWELEDNWRPVYCLKIRHITLLILLLFAKWAAKFIVTILNQKDSISL
jgi:hypothetical protein